MGLQGVSRIIIAKKTVVVVVVCRDGCGASDSDSDSDGSEGEGGEKRCEERRKRILDVFIESEFRKRRRVCFYTFRSFCIYHGSVYIFPG